MTTANRFRNRWTINECLQLQREFELLELSIDEISTRHQRTPNAIMLKLGREGFADYNVLYSNYHGLNSTIPITNIVSNEEKDEELYQDVQEQDVQEQDVQEQDEDNSSDYEDEGEGEGEDEDDSLKAHVMRLEKQVTMLTEMIMKNNKNKSLFSLFS
jgi:hypothetical protein